MTLIDFDSIKWDEIPDDCGYVHKDDIKEYLASLPSTIALPITSSRDTKTRLCAMDVVVHMSKAMAAFTRMLTRMIDVGPQGKEKEHG